MTYAAQISNSVCVQVIVGDAEWANQRLGGCWIHSDVLVGVGWLWDGVALTPPPSPEPEPFELVELEPFDG